MEARSNLKKAIDSKDEIAISETRDRLLQSYKTAEECFIDTQIKIIEDSSFSQRHSTAWSVLNEVTGRKPDSPPAKLKGSVEERKEKWKDYFCNLLGQPPRVPGDNFDITPVVDYVLPIDEGPFTLHELSKALKSTKRGGAVGVDSIPLEIW